jgi:chemotaxis protein methyltransferase CheR
MHLSATDFAFIASFIRREAAIVLGPGKEYLVQSRLAPLVREGGMRGVHELIHQLRHDDDPRLRQAVIDALTTNETSWFRDGEPFTALTQTVLPDLLDSRTTGKHLRIWSAGCASGQEPYSLAILLRDFLPTGWTFEIIATDISAEMVAKAEAGQFTQVEVNRGLPAVMLVDHFERMGTRWVISEELRHSVKFKQLNLAAPLPPMGLFDLVFLRNVLIYFDVDTKADILRRVSSTMRPDGLVFLGSAETTIGIDEGFERIAVGRSAAYRLRTAVPVGAAGRV